MSRKIELIHAGRWTSTQVVRLVRALVCPSCEVVDVDLESTGQKGPPERSSSQPQVRVLGRTIWLDESPTVDAGSLRPDADVPR
ncbi:MAG: hypothetical protein AB7G12_16005 [Thermoanaerobaculia bacterium]